MSRPNIDQYFIDLAKLVASRSTCRRRAVGAIAVSKEKYLLSTGYNGVPAGVPHCTDKPCVGVSYSTGKGLDFCSSIHAEVNTIAHCHNPQEIHTMYMTTSPCMPCMKLIVATGCRRIVYLETYDNNALTYFSASDGRFLKLDN